MSEHGLQMKDTSHDDDRRRWFALIVLCLGTLMIVLDTTIVNVALPSIRTDLGFSQTSLAWVVNAYLLTFGGFLLLGGRLGDLYGHRRLFVGGITLFTAASLCCGLANTQELLVIARAVQGLGGAVSSAVALSLMMTLFTEPAERAKAMGIFGFVASGGGSIGVLLGGILTDSLDWHWIFLVNLPIGVAVCMLSLRLLPAGRGPAGGRLDVAGAVTVTAALMIAVYAIVNGNQEGWTSARTLGELAAAVAILGLFLGIESHVRAPLMPLGLFRSRNLAFANVVGVLWAAAMFAWFFMSALYLQLVLGYTPLDVGLAFLPANLIMGALSIGVSARLVMRFGIRRPLTTGLLIAAAGLALLARAPVDGSYADRRAAEHDPARHRRRHRLQPRAAGGHERRQARGVGTCLGHRQHRLHDGRSARPGGAGEPGVVSHRQPAQLRPRQAGRPERRIPRGAAGGCGVRGRGGDDRRGVPAHEHVRAAACARGAAAGEPGGRVNAKPSAPARIR